MHIFQVKTLETSRQDTRAYVITHCFSKAQIAKDVQAAETDSREGEPPGLPDWDSLHTNGAVPHNVQLCDLLYVNDNTFTTKNMSDAAPMKGSIS